MAKKPTYFEINEENKSLMRNETKKVHYDWVDTKLLDELSLCFAQNNLYSEESSEVNDILNSINELLNSFKNGRITTDKFLKELGPYCKKLDLLPKKYYQRDYKNYEWNIKKYLRVILHAPGGMGKSRFFYDLEERLTKQNINHLVIYGKFTNNINAIDFEEIHRIIKSQTFILCVDALNEFEKNDLKYLLDELAKFDGEQNIFIYVSYRDYALSKNNINNFKKYTSIYFNGVDYNDGLFHLILEKGLNPMQFENLLETNSPLYIEALSKILSNNKYLSNEKNVVKITGVLEGYIKNVCDDNRNGRGCWQLFKKLAKAMFDLGRKRLNLNHDNVVLTKSEQKCLSELLQYGFVIEINGTYLFANETLADYLIIRQAFDALHKDEAHSLEKLKNLFDNFYSLKHIALCYLADKYGINDKTFFILDKLNLSFDFDVLSILTYNETDIVYLNNKIRNVDPMMSFVYMGGLSQKPFNFSNKLNAVFMEKDFKFMMFCQKFESENLYLNLIKKRLRNILIMSSFGTDFISKNLEIYYFAQWSLCLPNYDIWLLAKKVLLTLFDTSNLYVSKSLETLNATDNDFIRDGLIEALACSSSSNNSYISDYLEECLKDPDFLNAFNIAKIERRFKRKIDPCRYVKNDYFKASKDEWLTDENVKLFQKMYFSHDIWLTFEVSDRRYITSTLRFIDANKNEIDKLNKELSKKYICFADGECCGYMSVEPHLKALYPNYKVIEPKIMAQITSYFLTELGSKYNISAEDLSNGYSYRKGRNSLFFKLIKIAESYMLGSLMGNYFTDEFDTYNGYGNPPIGFVPYDPLIFESDYYFLNAFIPTYNEDVFILNNKILKEIKDGRIHDKRWCDDVEFAKAKIQNLLKPLRYNKHEWVPICLTAEIIDNESSNSPREYISFRVEYDSDYQIKRYEEHRKHTIEFDSYISNILDYCKHSPNDHLCHVVDRFSRDDVGIINRDVVLPPSSIIDELGLKYDPIMKCFRDGKESIIFLDANPVTYYEFPIKNSIYMRKDYFEKLKKNITYFGFNEKYNIDTGYQNEASIYFQISNDGKLICFKHYEQPPLIAKEMLKKCKLCRKTIGLAAKQALERANNEQISLIFKDLKNDME